MNSATRMKQLSIGGYVAITGMTSISGLLWLPRDPHDKTPWIEPHTHSRWASLQVRVGVEPVLRNGWITYDTCEWVQALMEHTDARESYPPLFLPH